MENDGWALEIREEWVDLLRSGTKTVELRAYPLPGDLSGKRIAIVATPTLPPGAPPVSGLPDTVPAGFPGASLVGVITFNEVITYTSEEQWAADYSRHRVAPGTPFAWQPGVTEVLYGWVVGHATWEEVPAPVPAMQRYMRSIFRILPEPSNP